MTLFKYDSTEFSAKIQQKLTLDLEPLSVTTARHKYFYDLIMRTSFKKFLTADQDIDTEEEAKKLFLKVNARMGRYNADFPRSLEEVSPVSERVRRVVAGILGTCPTWEEVFSYSRHSSGVTLGLKFIDTSLEAKMKFPLSGSKFAATLWQAYKFWDFELYSQACSAYETSGITPEVVITEGSRSSIVPKTNKIGRMIAVEPTLNMFFQQGLAAIMTERLSDVGLDVHRDPEKHRRLAFWASCGGHLATIDFSSMSDSLSLAICHYLLPKEWYSMLYHIRSHKMKMEGKYIPLHMISTMGNATTFPLETLILYATAVACSNHLDNNVKGIGPIQRNDCHVFGDDCIVRTHVAPLFIYICQKYGFNANSDKTFVEGRFRESCGGDFYHGWDVRPHYFKGLSATVTRRKCKEAYLYTQINGVLRMYRKYFGPVRYVYGSALLRFLFEQLKLQTNQVKFVPEDFPEDAGICALRDAARFIVHYGVNPSRVTLDQHGSMRFTYLSYRLPNKGPIHEGIRYASLKKAGFPSRKEDLEKVRPIRKGGFYVEKKGSALLTLPSTLY